VGDVVEFQHLGDTIVIRFLQNADVEGENFSLKGDCIEVFIDNQDQNLKNVNNSPTIKEIYAIGNASFWQKLYSGKGNRISMYPMQKLLVLEGNAEITEANHGTVIGEILTLDNMNRRIKTEGLSTKRSSISFENAESFQNPWKRQQNKQDDERDKSK
jgi:lipopolysaccharide export system protein LptA